jgi:DMSO/TMAO reductase YedYZ molybdopterin-dependent catalytic subunit
MDPNRGIMLAHKMNGEMLRPDHGKPLRAVIPGQIGGRSVKWLKKLIITAEPSDNWYHIYDNRVLPYVIASKYYQRDTNIEQHNGRPRRGSKELEMVDGRPLCHI